VPQPPSLNNQTNATNENNTEKDAGAKELDDQQMPSFWIGCIVFAAVYIVGSVLKRIAMRVT
jgi:hypothetical protein